MSELDPLFHRSNPYLDDPDGAAAWVQLVDTDRGFSMLCKADDIRSKLATAPELNPETAIISSGWSDVANPHCIRLVEQSIQKARASLLTKYGRWLVTRHVD
jgi:hypothetical protein